MAGIAPSTAKAGLAHPRRQTLSRERWIAAALEVLETRGIADVKIDALSKRFKVTRGSFYFHFSGLEDLQQALLNEWRSCNCLPFEKLVGARDIDGASFFAIIVRTWVDEDPFRPRLDLAVRDWSRTNPELAEAVAKADDLRIALLTRAFRAIGYGKDESLVRARITYFHQIGYYALPFKETAANRKRFQPLYGQVLLGPLGDRAAAAR